jgi:hypothetical protein
MKEVSERARNGELTQTCCGRTYETKGFRHRVYRYMYVYMYAEACNTSMLIISFYIHTHPQSHRSNQKELDAALRQVTPRRSERTRCAVPSRDRSDVSLRRIFPRIPRVSHKRETATKNYDMGRQIPKYIMHSFVCCVTCSSPTTSDTLNDPTHPPTQPVATIQGERGHSRGYLTTV